MSSSLPQYTRWQFFKRSVIRDILHDIAENGLQQGQSVSITFLSKYPGVELPEYTVKSFPDGVRIALYSGNFWNMQVQYLDMSVDVILEERRRIKIPFEAVTAFQDSQGKVVMEMDPLPTEFRSKIIPCNAVYVGKG